MDEVARPKFYHLNSFSTVLPDFRTVFVSALTPIKIKTLIFREAPNRHALAMGKPLVLLSHRTFLNNFGENIRRILNF